VFPVKYEIYYYIPEVGILHSHVRENHAFYMQVVLHENAFRLHNSDELQLKTLVVSDFNFV
jgi:hypothetical protein